ncbi:MAG: radical SAM protein [Paracoccaceae bacterium]
MPLSLMYLANALRAEFEPVIIDTRLTDNLEAELRKHLDSAVFVGMSVMIGNQIRFSLAVASMVRRLAPTVPIVWGGTFPTMAARQTVADPRVDIVVRGDGEDVSRQLATALVNGHPLGDVPSIVFQDSDGTVVESKGQGIALPPLDGKLIPAWDMIDVSRYKDMELLASRGCGHSCSFCYVHKMHGSSWRGRSPEQVVDEIAHLITEYSAREIQFVDDNFFQKHKIVQRVAELIIERGLNIRWEATCRASDLSIFSDDFLRIIHQSGCREVFMGAETGSELQLERIKKRIDVSLTETACARAATFGIKVKTLWMIGLIGETEADRIATADLIDRLKRDFPNTAKISSYGIYTPYPGTPQTAEALDLGQVLPTHLDDWADYYHDNANQQYLTLSERRHLENMMWIQRYAHGRNRNKKGLAFLVDTALHYDARLRWKLRFFYGGFEWRLARLQYNRFVQRQLIEMFGADATPFRRASIRAEMADTIGSAGRVTLRPLARLRAAMSGRKSGDDKDVAQP